jgi:hypothetical protein
MSDQHEIERQLEQARGRLAACEREREQVWLDLMTYLRDDALYVERRLEDSLDGARGMEAALADAGALEVGEGARVRQGLAAALAFVQALAQVADNELYRMEVEDRPDTPDAGQTCETPNN